MYSIAVRLLKMYFITRLNISFRSYFCGGMHFFSGFNILRYPAISHPEFCTQINASVARSCVAILIPHWLQWQWPLEWQNMGIVTEELVPIILTCIIWGPYLSRHRNKFQCDNVYLVISINKGSSKDKLVIHPLCSLSFSWPILIFIIQPLIYQE